MITEQDKELQYNLFCSAIITLIVALAIYMATSNTALRKYANFCILCAGLFLFGAATRYIDADKCGNSLLWSIKKLGNLVDARLLLIMTIIPGVPPF